MNTDGPDKPPETLPESSPTTSKVDQPDVATDPTIASADPAVSAASGAEAGATETPSTPSPATEPSPQSPQSPPSPPSPPSPIDELRERVTEATSSFLKNRLGLEEGADGALHLPDRGVFENVGQRAEQFIRGFLKGVVERTPEEREVDAGVRAKNDVPNTTEIIGRLLSKASGAVSTSFHQYLKDHVPAAETSEPVVVDGRFLLQHGAPLLATFAQALGSQFADKSDPTQNTAAPAPEPVADLDEKTSPKVDYRVDLPSLFTSLFVRPREDDKHGGDGS